MIKRARTLFKHFSSTSVHHTELLKQTHTALQQAEEKRGHGLTRLWKKPKEKSWVLLIGKHGAGKTTLLEKSQYPLRSPFKKSIKNSPLSFSKRAGSLNRNAFKQVIKLL